MYDREWDRGRNFNHGCTQMDTDGMAARDGMADGIEFNEKTLKRQHLTPALSPASPCGGEGEASAAFDLAAAH